jgi:L-lactate dehydrogenase complex protein LldF
MAELLEKFLVDSNKKVLDGKHRNTINFNISKYDFAVVNGKKQYSDIELARERAAVIKRKVVNNLEEYLVNFEANCLKNGGKVVWAESVEDVHKEIARVVKKYNAKKVVKSKSMTTEEVKLNDYLEKNGIESIETDLGEYIQQIDNEPPYHIVTPAMHKSKQDVVELFNKKFNLPLDSTPEGITHFVRDKIKKDFLDAKIGITGGNFLIADTGSVCITENEGNASMAMAHPDVHIAIVGIEKLLPSINDLALFWPLLSTFGTGQKVTVYNSIISGPKKENEVDGPKEFIVILLDNGRTNLLSKPNQRAALSCIRCGACLNACPVYKNVGGHTYNTTYTGPIGSVISPHLNNLDEFKHLSYASSLCGRCTEVCPVKIDIHNQLLNNRKDAVDSGLTTKTENFSMNLWKKAMLNRGLLNVGSASIKNMVFKYMFSKQWGPRRENITFPKQTFNEWYKKNHKN